MTELPHTAAVRFQEETLPAYDRSHGTPHAMIRRVLVFELPQGKARWEQSDYGHPGRFNAWEARQIDARLQPRAAELRAVAEAMTALLAGSS